MTTDQKNLVKATVPVLKENGVALTSHFYNRMFVHNPELKHIFNMGNQKNQKQQTALAMAVLAYAEHIEDPSVLIPVLNNIGQKHTSLDIRPEQYTTVGKHLIASIGEVLGSSATPELLEAWTVAYEQLASLMSGMEQKIYNDQINKKGGWTGWRPFIVKKKVKESAEITSFYLYPSDGGHIADHKPGQYLSVRSFLPELNLLQPRQYSISCAPNGEYYRISVKRESGTLHTDGMISNRLHDHVHVGDLVDVSAPAGVFVLQEDIKGPKVFISGGVGQTPLIAMLEGLLAHNDKDEHITWIHGCRNEEVHAFKKTVSEISQEFTYFNQHVFYDVVESEEKFLHKGWVELANLDQKILHDKAQYYICGPGSFISKHYKYLIENKIPKSSIHFEEFGPASLQVS